MIITTTEKVRKYLSVNGSITFENIEAYLRKAERNYLKKIIGSEQITIFEGTPTDSIIIEGKELAEEAVANFAFYLYLPIGSVQITDAGILTASSENTAPASDKQFKELQRSFLKSGYEALDGLLEHMEESPDKFPEWFGSSSFTIYKDLLVNKTAVFNDYFYIFNSRQTFTAIKPTLKVVEDQFIIPVFGADLIADLKAVDQTNNNRKQVKKLLQQSIVAFTIMKTVNNGMFVLSAQGMHLKFDVLPYEKTATNVNLKINDFLVHTKKEKQIEGEEYLKIALDIIKDNTSDFSEYSAKESTTHLKTTETKSIFGM